MQEPTRLSIPFRKSSYSNASGECVEVAPYSPRQVAVRDSKDANGCLLAFAADGWQEFVSQVRAGHAPGKLDARG